ncbi:uncharacterized protein BT62DRAFT_1011212 [Guyanagaster necrorhizus]|uniref:Uncharacterized protein n=1 Tax=Guyanagaster necrorhizus TaxID=856835 RepID=A0A9P7VIU3_9AGAR|nr:uncharacterized protein BT62DRAFT_1011212 [Guyanagaster necrorhizus MCA 3950]KAG7441883.1 hypothetical protein BT62DRAFT_1011212 [Guyanagaster necrorhizus MCA 3950]
MSQPPATAGIATSRFNFHHRPVQTRTQTRSTLYLQSQPYSTLSRVCSRVYLAKNNQPICYIMRLEINVRVGYVSLQCLEAPSQNIWRRKLRNAIFVWPWSSVSPSFTWLTLYKCPKISFVPLAALVKEKLSTPGHPMRPSLPSVFSGSRRNGIYVVTIHFGPESCLLSPQSFMSILDANFLANRLWSQNLLKSVLNLSSARTVDEHLRKTSLDSVLLMPRNR